MSITATGADWLLKAFFNTPTSQYPVWEMKAILCDTDPEGMTLDDLISGSNVMAYQEDNSLVMGDPTLDGDYVVIEVSEDVVFDNVPDQSTATHVAIYSGFGDHKVLYASALGSTVNVNADPYTMSTSVGFKVAIKAVGSAAVDPIEFDTPYAVMISGSTTFFMDKRGAFDPTLELSQDFYSSGGFDMDSSGNFYMSNTTHDFGSYELDGTERWSDSYTTDTDNQLRGIFIDVSYMYVLTRNAGIRRYAKATGTEDTGWGPVSYTGTGARVNSARGTWYDGTYLYYQLVDAAGEFIRRVEVSTGTTTTTGPNAYDVSCIRVDASGDLYVGWRDTSNGYHVSKYTGTSQQWDYAMSAYPSLILSEDENYVYACDLADDELHKINASTGASVGGNFPLSDVHYQQNSGVMWEQDGYLYIRNQSTGQMERYNTDGTAATGLGFPNTYMGNLAPYWVKFFTP